MRSISGTATAAALALLLALPAAAAPSLTAMAKRFRSLGYTVTAAPRDGKRPYVAGIVIRDIDSDTLQSFNVAVYRFGSAAQAKAHRQALVAAFGRFPSSNQWQLEGADLFVGTTASTELHCTFSSSGQPHCKPYTFPRDRFRTVVAVAEGH